MLFTQNIGVGGQSITVAAMPGEYDAVPAVDAVRIDATPRTQHPDRAAVAYCLMFSTSIAGGFQLPDTGCSPHVADAISAFLDPTNVQVFPVNFTPSRIVGGEVTLELDMDGGIHNPAPGNALIGFINDGVGSMATMDRLVISTNASLLADEKGTAFERMLPVLGVAVLFCEDLFVGAIQLPQSLVTTADAKLVERLRKLLQSVNLRLTWS